MDLCLSGVIILREIELLSTWKTSQRLSGCLCFPLLGLWGPCREGRGVPTPAAQLVPGDITRFAAFRSNRVVRPKCCRSVALVVFELWASQLTVSFLTDACCDEAAAGKRSEPVFFVFLFFFAFHYFKIKILEGSMIICKYVHPFHPKKTFSHIWIPQEQLSSTEWVQAKLLFNNSVYLITLALRSANVPQRSFRTFCMKLQTKDELKLDTRMWKTMHLDMLDYL